MASQNKEHSPTELQLQVPHGTGIHRISLSNEESISFHILEGRKIRFDNYITPLVRLFSACGLCAVWKKYQMLIPGLNPTSLLGECAGLQHGCANKPA